MQEANKQLEIERDIDVFLLFRKEYQLWSKRGLYTEKIGEHQGLRIIDQTRNRKDPSVQNSDAWQRCRVYPIRKKVDKFHSRLPKADESER